MSQENPSAAALSYRQALAINKNDPAVWLKLANVMLTQADASYTAQNSSDMYDQGATASYAALMAFIQTQDSDKAGRAGAMGALAHALERREMFRESILTYRASLALVDNADLQKRLDDDVAQHGFRITDNSVDAEAADPRICLTFSDPLPLGGTDLSGYIVVDGAPKIAVETEQTQICITGVEHGKRYHIKARAGLPSADNEHLSKDVELDVYVADRSPFVGFCRQRLRAARRPRRRPADHFGQRPDRRHRRSTRSATARSRPRCATASSRAASPATRPKTSPTSTASRSGPARSTSRPAPTTRW